jgi:hypothetical protein
MEIRRTVRWTSATLARWHCTASETVYLTVSQFCYILTTGYFFPKKHNAFNIHIHEPGFTPLRNMWVYCQKVPSSGKNQQFGAFWRAAYFWCHVWREVLFVCWPLTAARCLCNLLNERHHRQRKTDWVVLLPLQTPHVEYSMFKLNA